MKLTEAEWAVMEALWAGESFSLGELTRALYPGQGWSKNTVHTYLKRMEAKGLVKIERSSPPPRGRARTGRMTPQTKAVGRPSTSTARQLRRPYFSHTAARRAETSAEAGVPRRSTRRRRA